MATLSECSIGALHANMNRLTNIFKSYVANERSGQQPRFAKNLEAIADAQHQPSIGGKLANRLHHRRKLGNSSRAQIVAISKATWNDDGITVLKIELFMQKKDNRLLGYGLDGLGQYVNELRYIK